VGDLSPSALRAISTLLELPDRKERLGLVARGHIFNSSKIVIWRQLSIEKRVEIVNALGMNIKDEKVREQYERALLDCLTDEEKLKLAQSEEREKRERASLQANQTRLNMEKEKAAAAARAQVPPRAQSSSASPSLFDEVSRRNSSQKKASQPDDSSLTQRIIAAEILLGDT
jgi:hypothetical protein